MFIIFNVRNTLIKQEIDIPKEFQIFLFIRALTNDINSQNPKPRFLFLLSIYRFITSLSLKYVFNHWLDDLTQLSRCFKI